MTWLHIPWHIGVFKVGRSDLELQVPDVKGMEGGGGGVLDRGGSAIKCGVGSLVGTSSFRFFCRVTLQTADRDLRGALGLLGRFGGRRNMQNGMQTGHSR